MFCSSSLVIEMRQEDIKDESSAFHKLQVKLIEADVNDRICRAAACLPGAGLLAPSTLAEAISSELMPELRKLVNRATPETFLKEWWRNRLQALHVMPASTTLDASVVIVIHDIELAPVEVVQNLIRFIAACSTSSGCHPRLFVIIASCTSRVRLYGHLTRQVTASLEVHEVQFSKPRAIINMLVSRLQVFGLCPMFLPQSLLGEVQELALMNNLGVGFFCHTLRCVANLHFGRYTESSKSVDTFLLKFLVLPAELIAAVALEEKGRTACLDTDYMETPLWAVCSRMASFLRENHLATILSLASYKDMCRGATPAVAVRAAVREDILHINSAQVRSHLAVDNAAMMHAGGATPAPPGTAAELTTWVYRKDVRKELAAIHASCSPFGVPRGILPIHRSEDEVCAPCEPVSQINCSIHIGRSTCSNASECNDQLALITTALYRIHSHRICWLPAASVICCAAGVRLFNGDGELCHEVRDLHESSLRATEATTSLHLLNKAASRIAHMSAVDIRNFLLHSLRVLSGTSIGDAVKDAAWLALNDTWKFVLPLRAAFTRTLRELDSLLSQSEAVLNTPVQLDTASDATKPLISITPGRRGRGAMAVATALNADNSSPLNDLRTSVHAWLRGFSARHLAQVDSLPLHELFMAPSWKDVQPYVSASPMAEFFGELGHPCVAMCCKCCSAAQSILEPSNEDISLAYRSLKATLSESSKTVQQQQWYECFRSAFNKQLAECQARDQLRRNAQAAKPQAKRTRANTDPVDESVEALEVDIQERFTHAAQECEFLGIVRLVSGKDELSYEAICLDPKEFWGGV
jgi:hypothetical protein